MVHLMKKTMKNYHFCISGGDEILFRSEEDYIRAFNTLAITVARLGGKLAADAIMSTHIHVCVRTDDIGSIISQFWRSYTRYFNYKYRRKGALGGSPYVVEIEGFYHWLTAICYVLRNPVHHGVAPTPFAYRHCSANAIFRKETGKCETFGCLPRKSYYKFLPKGQNCPAEYVMDASGMIKRETVLDLADIEHRFVTPRAYLFYMNRLSGEEWRREQEKDQDVASPVSLEMIERNTTSQSISEMLGHEHGRSDYRTITDIELCEFIDMQVLPKYNLTSVYEVPSHLKQTLLDHVLSVKSVKVSRAQRCLML